MDPLQSLSTSLKSSGIIPDVIPSHLASDSSLSTKFKILFTITYPTQSGSPGPLLGEELKREDTTSEPEIVFLPFSNNDTFSESQGEGERRYTLVMTDPDAPSRQDPKFGEFRHWVIPGLTLSTEKDKIVALKTKPAHTPYYPPGPPPGTGLHRYVFLLFEEPLSSSFSLPPSPSEMADRRNWNAMRFADENGLELVGVNWFVCQNEKQD